MKTVRTVSTVMLVVVGAVVLLAGPPPKPMSLVARADFGAGSVTTSGPLGGAISNGIYSVRVTPTGSSPALAVDLGGFLGDETRECATATLAGCNTDGPLDGVLELNDFDVRVKPLTSSGPEADDLPGGLTGMGCPVPGSPVRAPAPALVHFTFWLPGGDGHWGLNASPRYRADAVWVERTSPTTWEVTSPGENGDEAELVSFAHSAILRKSGPSHEGVYALPFSITIYADKATCPQP
jgi:hypothetical protein